jgi:hypothetical protein
MTAERHSSDIRATSFEVRSDWNAAQGEGRARPGEAPGVTPTDAHGEPPAVGDRPPTRAVKARLAPHPSSIRRFAAPRECRPAGTLSIRPVAVAIHASGRIGARLGTSLRRMRARPRLLRSQPRSVRHHDSRARRAVNRGTVNHAPKPSIRRCCTAAACPAGLEAALAAELRALGAQVTPVRPAALSRGDHALGYAVNPFAHCQPRAAACEHRAVSW